MRQRGSYAVELRRASGQQAVPTTGGRDLVAGDPGLYPTAGGDRDSHGYLVSRVSSTRPFAPRPKEPPRSGWRSWRRIVPAIGAALGLIATLWATLIGQSLPELLRDENAPINTFHSKIGHVCADMEQFVRSPTAHEKWGYRGQPPLVMWASVSSVEDDAKQPLAAIPAPALYRAEYAALRRDLKSAARAASSYKSTAPGVEKGAQRIEQDLDDAADRALTMGSDQCAELFQTLNDIAWVCETAKAIGKRPHRRLACVQRPAPGAI